MKKLLSLALIATLLLALAACGKSAVPVPNAPLVLGEKYLSDLDYEQALLQFDQAIEIDPKNPRVYLGKADALLHLDRQEEAAQTLSDGAKAVPRDWRKVLRTTLTEVVKSAVDGYIALSSAYERLGWRDNAFALLKRVCEEFPEESRLRDAFERMRATRAKESAVPNVINMTLDEAKALLDALGIAYEIQHEGDGNEGNVVIGQEIKSVVLTVGQGAETAETIEPPTAAGENETTEAENTAEADKVKSLPKRIKYYKTDGTYNGFAEFEYDEMGNVVREASSTLGYEPYVEISEYEYDDKGNMVKSTVPDDQTGEPITTTFEYDDKGNKTHFRTSYGSTYTYKYDDNGKLIEFTDGEYWTTTYEYDSAGNLVREVTLHHEWNATFTTTYMYDTAGKLIRKTYPSGESEDGEGYEAEERYKYNSDGTISRMDFFSSHDRYGPLEQNTYHLYEY